MKKLIGVIIFSLILCSGCTDYSTLRKGVILHNENVSFLSNSFNENHEKAVQIKDILISAFYNGELSDSVKDFLGYSLNYESVSNEVENIHEQMVINYESIKSFSESREISTNDLTMESIYGNAIGVYYFLDSDTGVLEQLFVVRYPNGNIHKLSLMWLGGVCFEVKNDFYN